MLRQRTLKRRKERLLAAARQRAQKTCQEDTTPGLASKYIYHFEDWIKLHPNQPVVLFARVSGRDQHRKGRLKSQCRNLKRKTTKGGAQFLKGFIEVGSGWEEVSQREIAQAAKYAKKHGTCVVAESVARLLRSINYFPYDQDKQPTDAELRSFVKELGVPIVTLLEPDASPEETRAYETQRGQRYSQAQSGRPRKPKPGYKKRSREELLPMVLQLSREENSYREIEAKTGVKFSTARDWIHASRMKCADF